ncbi:amino acid permease [Stomatohabitans albus]|uniref:amino acid permease n=1 Tax=Stomatohabitans albus TaxID=3110766 RepID=UPI00300C7DDC
MATAAPQVDESKPEPATITRLANWHIGFIALGGAIGTGLFLGAGGGIQSAGPAVLIAYLLSGLTIYVMLRCQAEMTIEHPATGNFSAHAGLAFGQLAALFTGWVYVFLMLVVSLADTVALVHVYFPYVFPSVPHWVWAIAVIGVIALINVMPVRVFGSVETGMTIMKVGAVVAIIIGGIVIWAFGLGGDNVAISNLWSHGGFLPNGLAGFAGSLAITLFAFGGTEAIGFAAADSEDVKTGTIHAVNTVPIRIALFYIASVAILMVLVPWNQVSTESSPFVTIFSQIGITWAAAFMNVVVVLAALSAVNALIYAAGRMITGMAEQGLAPELLAKRNRFGTPVASIIALILVLSTSVVANELVPDGLFLTVAMVATIFLMFTWGAIIVTQLKLHYGKGTQDRSDHGFLVPFTPYAQILALGWMGIILIVLIADEGSRVSVIVGTLALLAVGMLSWLTMKVRTTKEQSLQ